MKIVLLAGGLGTRLREETEFRPKPMVPVGGKPILWHIMKTFAHYGHQEFIVCAGYRGDYIRQYFHDFEAMNSDFTVHIGQQMVKSSHGVLEESGWVVTVADTGADTMTGGEFFGLEIMLVKKPLCVPMAMVWQMLILKNFLPSINPTARSQQ